MATFVIWISSYSSEESVWTSTARVILFGTIPTTIPSTTPIVDLPVIHDDTLWIPTDTPTILPIVPTILPIAPTIQYTFPFISTNSSGSDTSERPPSQDPYEVTVARWRSRVAPIPVGRPYRTQPNGTATSVRPSHKRCRSPTSLVLVALPVRESLSHVHADLLSPPKRIKDSDSVIDFEADIDECFAYIDAIRARGTDVRVVVETATDEEVESSARGTVEVDLRVIPVIDEDVCESVREDVLDHVTTDGAVEVTYETLGDLRDHGHRIMETSQQSDTMSERIGTLERDNRRLKGMLDVERHKVDCIWHSMSYVQRDFRQIRRFCFYDRVRIGRLEAYAMRHWDIALIFLTMPTATRSGITQDAINELVAKRVEEALKLYEVVKNLITEIGIEDGQQVDNVKANGDNGNGNGNGNGNPNVNNRGVVPVARECTYQDFMKCQPLNFKGTKGVIGLTRWFEKIEIVFHISNCPPRNKTGNNKAKARVYAIRGGGANPDSNVVTGDGCNRGSRSKLSIISCTKTQKYILKGCQVYLAQVTTNKSDDK
nr:hypothetical protein [Tanacetum cinerariifolium]